MTVGPIGASLEIEIQSASVRVVIGSDHAGFSLNQGFVMHLRDRGHDVTDARSFDPNPVDFPNIARALTTRILSGEAERGMMVCGTGPNFRRRIARLPELEAS